MDFVWQEIQTSIEYTKDKFTKLYKLYLYNFVNKAEEYEKPTEVSHTNKSKDLFDL